MEQQLQIKPALIIVFIYNKIICTLVCCVLQWRRGMQSFISKVKQAVGILRKAFQKTIEDRIGAMHAGNYVPNDTLQHLLRGLGKYLFTYSSCSQHTMMCIEQGYLFLNFCLTVIWHTSTIPVATCAKNSKVLMSWHRMLVARLCLWMIWNWKPIQKFQNHKFMAWIECSRNKSFTDDRRFVGRLCHPLCSRWELLTETDNVIVTRCV